MVPKFRIRGRLGFRDQDSRVILVDQYDLLAYAFKSICETKTSRHVEFEFPKVKHELGSRLLCGLVSSRIIYAWRPFQFGVAATNATPLASIANHSIVTRFFTKGLYSLHSSPCSKPMPIISSQRIGRPNWTRILGLSTRKRWSQRANRLDWRWFTSGQRLCHAWWNDLENFN